MIGPAAGASGAAPLLRLGSLHDDASIDSLWRRAPVLDAPDTDAAELRPACTSPGHCWTPRVQLSLTAD